MRFFAFALALMWASVSFGFVSTNTTNITVGASTGGSYGQFDIPWAGFDDQYMSFNLSQEITNHTWYFKLAQDSYTGQVAYLLVTNITYATTNASFEVARTNIPPNGTYKAALRATAAGGGYDVARGMVTVTDSLYDDSDGSYTYPSIPDLSTYYAVAGDTLEGTMNANGNSILAPVITNGTVHPTHMDSIAIDMGTVSDNQIMKYNSALNVWTNEADEGSGTGTTEIILPGSDITITTNGVSNTVAVADSFLRNDANDVTTGDLGVGGQLSVTENIAAWGSDISVADLGLSLIATGSIIGTTGNVTNYIAEWITEDASGLYATAIIAAEDASFYLVGEDEGSHSIELAFIAVDDVTGAFMQSWSVWGSSPSGDGGGKLSFRYLDAKETTGASVNFGQLQLYTNGLTVIGADDTLKYGARIHGDTEVSEGTLLVSGAAPPFVRVNAEDNSEDATVRFTEQGLNYGGYIAYGVGDTFRIGVEENGTPEAVMTMPRGAASGDIFFGEDVSVTNGGLGVGTSASAGAKAQLLVKGTGTGAGATYAIQVDNSGDTKTFHVADNGSVVSAATGNFGGTMTIGEITIPATTGTVGQVLKQVAGGALEWAADAGAAGGDSLSVNGTELEDPNFVDSATVEYTLTGTTQAVPSVVAGSIGNSHMAADAVLLNEVGNPDGNQTFAMEDKQLIFNYTAPQTGDGAFEIQAIGGFDGDLMHVHQHTGNPGAGTDLVHYEAADADVTGVRITVNDSANAVDIEDGNVMIQSGTLTVTGAVTATSFSGTGSALTAVDAATLDTLDSLQFLRADANDAWGNAGASGTLTLGDATGGADIIAVVGSLKLTGYVTDPAASTVISVPADISSGSLVLGDVDGAGSTTTLTIDDSTTTITASHDLDVTGQVTFRSKTTVTAVDYTNLYSGEVILVTAADKDITVKPAPTDGWNFKVICPDSADNFDIVTTGATNMYWVNNATTASATKREITNGTAVVTWFADESYWTIEGN